jgi:hypothetical protein
VLSFVLVYTSVLSKIASKIKDEKYIKKKQMEKVESR